MNFNKFFDFIGSPSKAFDNEKKTTLGEAFKFMIFGLFILAIISTIIGVIVLAVAATFISSFMPLGIIPFGAAGAIGAGIVVMMFIGTLVGGIIASLIWGLWLHLWVYIFGSRKGLDNTFKSVFYGMSPHYILGWIPVINIIILIWSIVVQGIGLTKLHEITRGKAAGAIILAIIIPVIIIVAIAGTMFMSMMSLMGGIPTV